VKCFLISNEYQFNIHHGQFFYRIENGPLTVFFNIHVDTHRIRVDAGDLFIVLADALKTSNGKLTPELLIDQDSLEIQGKSGKKCWLN